MQSGGVVVAGVAVFLVVGVRCAATAQGFGKETETVANVAPGFHADDGVVWACLLWACLGVFFGGVPSWVASWGMPCAVGAPARLV